MEKMLDKKSRDFAKNMRDKMIYDKSKNEVQIGTNLYVDGKITSSAPSEGGKVYLHNIYINTNKKAGYMKLYTTSNEPFTKDLLVSFMVNNGITSRVKGFPLAYTSTEATSEGASKLLNTNFIACVENNSLIISNDVVVFNIVENKINLTVNIDNFNFVDTITDTVIEL